MLHETFNKAATRDLTVRRKFQRQAKRLLYRLATNGLGLRRNDFQIRVADGISGGAILVSLQTDQWYVTVSPPLQSQRANVTYLTCNGRDSLPTGPVKYARIGSVLDVHRFARELKQASTPSVGAKPNTTLRSNIRR
jgi:hypothetical protein